MKGLENASAPETGKSPLEVAHERWGVDLNDDRAILIKLQQLRGKMPDVVDLANLWKDNQSQKAAVERNIVANDIRKAA